MSYRFNYDDNTAVVKTINGVLKGYFYKDTYVFKGVPYGKATRFHEAERVNFDGVLDCSNYGYVCPLTSYGKPNGELNVPHRYWPTDEDCLSLNIWTPQIDNKKRSVVVWLHGGGFDFGSSIEQLAYEGNNFSSAGDVVLVSLNHRLNCLGFLDLSDFGKEYANTANLGMDDIILALKWIKDNISFFGGNPDDVTLIGQSGGGMKITTLLQMPAADGLFHKGIIMSGVAGYLLPDATYDPKALVNAMMEDLNLKSIKELETIDYYLLAKSFQKCGNKLKIYNGTGVASAPRKNKFYYGEPTVNGFRKETKDIPLLIGSVYGEFVGFVKDNYCKKQLTKEEGLKLARAKLGDDMDELMPLYQKAYPERNPVDITKLDTIFRPAVIDYISKRSAVCSQTYAYMFNQDFTMNGGKCPWHCCDIPYVFKNCELVENTQEDGVVDILEKQVFETFVAFAKNGNPNNDNIPHVEPSTSINENTIIFKINPEVKTNYDHEIVSKLLVANMKLMAKMAKEMNSNIQH